MTSFGVLQVLWACCGFGFCILPCGYLLTLAVLRRRQVSSGEALLWTLALGLPAAVAISVWGQRVFSRGMVNICFFILAAVALTLTLPNRKHFPESVRIANPLRALAVLGLLFALYCLLETLDITVGHHLFLSTLLNDWSPRVAMVKGAMRSAVPPLNGLSTLSAAGIGTAPPLRYYYFWYVLVAQIASTLHLGAQPTLSAGCIWSGWGFLSAAFLSLKYMLEARRRWASACLVLLGLLATLGLDILPTALMWLSRTAHPLLEMEWWRPDRTPSFLGMVLASPHHVAGFCSLLLGTLLLLLLARAEGETRSVSAAQHLVFAALAGLLFATASGLSLFPTFCFAIALSFWAVDLLRRRQWSTLGSLAGAGVLALLLAHSYLTELSTGSSAAHGFANFAWRSDSFAAVEIARYLHPHSHGPVLTFILRQPVVFLLDFMELGFYLFVLVAAIRQDLLRPGRLSPGRCVWWSLLLGAALPTFFISSVATSGPNDLGFDAGFMFRLCLQLWAAEWVMQHWWRRHEVKTAWQRLGFAAAVSLAALGLAGQLYQALSIRLYFAVVRSSLVHKQIDTLAKDHLSERLFNIRDALRRFDQQVPPSRPDTEAVQFNPIGVLVEPEVYFNTHQVASWDSGCGTSFGGDYAHCAPIYASLLFLYGNTQRGTLQSRALNTAQDGAAARVATEADLDSVCRNLKLRAVVADATDSIWAHPDSWVWTGPVLVANSTVRVIGCPAGSWRP